MVIQEFNSQIAAIRKLRAKNNVAKKTLNKLKTLGFNTDSVQLYDDHAEILRLADVIVQQGASGVLELVKSAVKIKEKHTLTAEEVSIGVNVGKLDAIREYKFRTGLSLYEAKQNVEKHFKDNGLTFKTQDKHDA